MTSLAPWPTIQPHRLVWEERSYTDGVPDGVPEIWYAPMADLDRDIVVDQHGDGGWHVFYGAGYGPPHTKLEDAIADAERSIFASAYNQIIALGGWDAVAAVAAAAAAATRPTQSGS